MKLKVNDSNPAQIFVKHDPALRIEAHNESQREYLVELGPFQLRLPCFSPTKIRQRKAESLFTTVV